LPSAEENDIPPISVDLDILDKLKARVQLARKIDGAQHKINKKNHDRNWIKAAAEAMEIEVDSESDRRVFYLFNYIAVLCSHVSTYPAISRTKMTNTHDTRGRSKI
jgi:hypothetical protein